MGFGRGLVTGTILGAVLTIGAALIADRLIDNDDEAETEDGKSGDE